MPVEQRPIHRPGSPESAFDESLYAAFAAAQFRILKDYMRMARLNTYSRVVTLANGVVITCQKSFNREDIFISIPPVALFTEEIKSIVMHTFLSNPRIYGENDGYRFVDGKLLPFGVGDIEYSFGSAYASTQRLIIGGDDGKEVDSAGLPTVTVRRDVMEYGNIDWKGINTAGAGEVPNATALTWKGPQGRSIAFDNTLPIEGLTSPDIQLADEIRYTCFFSKIYSKGAVFKTVPLPPNGDAEPKVLGAAIQKDGTFVCVVNNHYSNKVGFWEEAWSNNGAEGFYDNTANPKGWRKLSERLAGRPTMIWAFNQSGTKATQGTTEYTLDVAAGVAIFTSDDPGAIKYVLDNSNPNGDHSTTYSGEFTVWSDYKGDERVFAKVVASGGHVFQAEFTSDDTMIDAPRYALRQPVVVTPYIEYLGYGQYALRGDFVECCDAITEWSMVGGTIDSTGLVIAETGCGMGSITARYCGVAVTIPVVLASGVWALTSSCSSSCGGTVHEYISGNTKTVETIADVWGGPNQCGTTNVNIYSETTTPRCNKNIAVTSCNYWDTAANCGSTCGAPTLSYTPTPPPAPLTVTYSTCDDNGYPNGTVDIAVEQRHTVVCTSRQIYTWSCPP